MARRVIVFDVNETLLDLGGLDDLFESIFGDALARSQWFAQLLRTIAISHRWPVLRWIRWLSDIECNQPSMSFRFSCSVCSSWRHTVMRPRPWNA